MMTDPEALAFTVLSFCPPRILAVYVLEAPQGKKRQSWDHKDG